MSDELKEFNFEKAIRNPYIKKDWKFKNQFLEML